MTILKKGFDFKKPMKFVKAKKKKKTPKGWISVQQRGISELKWFYVDNFIFK